MKLAGILFLLHQPVLKLQYPSMFCDCDPGSINTVVVVVVPTPRAGIVDYENIIVMMNGTEK